MWVCVHLISGAAAGSLLGRMGVPRPLVPLAGPPLHAALDAVPHWDYTVHHLRSLWSALDVAATAGLLAAGARRGLPPEDLAAGLLSAAPDLDVAREAIAPSPHRRFFPSHRPGFPHGRSRFLPGLAIQGVIAGIGALALARRISPR